MSHEINYSLCCYYHSMYFQILYIINNFHITCYTSNFALSVFFLGDFRRPVSSYTVTARRKNKCFDSKRQIILKRIEHHHSMYVVLLNAETRIFIFGFMDVKKKKKWQCIFILTDWLEYFSNSIELIVPVRIALPGIIGHGFPLSEHLSILAVWVK